MSSKAIVGLIALVVASQSIFLMVKPKVPRCMVEYLTGQGYESTMKIMVDFPSIPDSKGYEHFYVTLRNTESNETETATLKPGTKFNKQKVFEKSIIYEICINFRSDQEKDVMILYEAEKQFRTVETKPVVPPHLLKKEDFKETYIAAAYLTQTISDYNLEYKARGVEQYKSFEVIESAGKSQTIVSVIELVVLLASGLYQFFTLKNYLAGRQYI